MVHYQLNWLKLWKHRHKRSVGSYLVRRVVLRGLGHLLQLSERARGRRPRARVVLLLLLEAEVAALVARAAGSAWTARTARTLHHAAARCCAQYSLLITTKYELSRINNIIPVYNVIFC